MSSKMFIKLAVILIAVLAVACGGGKEEYEIPGLDIQVKTVPAQKITYVEVIGPYWEIGDDCAAFVNWAMKTFPSMTAPSMLGIFYDNPETVAADSLRSEIALGVPPDFKGDAEHKVRELPEMMVASVVLKGPYAEIAKRYNEIYGWIAQHNYSVAGPLYEVYHKAGPDIPESEYETEIRIPVTEIPG